jgi:uncharacterized lipoprotein YmbA
MMRQWIYLCSGAAAMALALAGCSSTPTQYLTLVPSAAQSATGGNAVGPTVSVTIPSQVDQPQLAIRRSDGSMVLLEYERWIAPLSDEIRTALTLALARQWPAGSADAVRVSVDVQRFDSVPGQYALLDAVWTLTTIGSPPQTTSCRSSIRIPVDGGYPALARGHQAAIEQLATQIARQASSAHSSTGTGAGACAPAAAP